MILLDTNVLSEFMRPQPSVQVVSWLDRLSLRWVVTTIHRHLHMQQAITDSENLLQRGEASFAAVTQFLVSHRSLTTSSQTLGTSKGLLR